MRGVAGLVGVLTVAAGLSACTAAPQSIAQSDVSPISYDSLNCFDLLDELEQVDAAPFHASQQQEQAQSSDAAGGVSVIGVPASTLSSTDVAPQLGSGEAQRQAIQRAMAQKQCRVTLDTERVTSWRSKDCRPLSRMRPSASSRPQHRVAVALFRPHRGRSTGTISVGN